MHPRIISSSVIPISIAKLTKNRASTLTIKICLLAFSLTLLGGCTIPLSKKTILVIGDDHAAGANGWVFHFQQLRKGGPMVNAAVAGATTAFPSPSQPSLNTLDQLIPYLRRGFAEMGSIDEIIIQLGTNDCQERYQSGDVERSVKFRELIANTKNFFQERGQSVPKIVLLSPPTIADKAKGPQLEGATSADFENGHSCVQAIAKDLEMLAAKEGFCYLDLTQNEQLAAYLSEDGVTYQAEGLKLMAQLLKGDCY